MIKSQKKKTYSPEFKVEAVKLVESIGITKAAIELGVNVNSLRTWAQRAKANGSTEMEKPSYKDLQAENRRLRRELGYMQTINEVLKKSTAILAKDAMDDLK